MLSIVAVVVAALSWHTSEKNTEISRRAYLASVTPVLQTADASLVNNSLEESRVPIQSITKNIGNGNAYNIKIFQIVGLNRNFLFPWPSENIVATHQQDVLSGVGALKVNSYPNFTEEQVKEIQNNKLIFYVYGLVEYEQILWDKPEKKSYTYCYYYATKLGNTNAFVQCPFLPKLNALNESRSKQLLSP